MTGNDPGRDWPVGVYRPAATEWRRFGDDGETGREVSRVGQQWFVPKADLDTAPPRGVDYVLPQTGSIAFRMAADHSPA